jgi:hypothetical protein
MSLFRPPSTSLREGFELGSSYEARAIGFAVSHVSKARSPSAALGAGFRLRWGQALGTRAFVAEVECGGTEVPHTFYIAAFGPTEVGPCYGHGLAPEIVAGVEWAGWGSRFPMSQKRDPSASLSDCLWGVRRSAPTGLGGMEGNRTQGYAALHPGLASLPPYGRQRGGARGIGVCPCLRSEFFRLRSATGYGAHDGLPWGALVRWTGNP